MARQTQSAIAKTIRPPVTDSTIAGLEGKVNTASATAAPAVGLKTGKNFTGQYLYDRFVANDKTEVTKLDIVRSMATALEVDDFKTAINEMVSIAVNLRDRAIKDAKEAGAYDKASPNAEISAYAARLKTAQNHQTVMRVAFGALKFCADDLEKFGYDANTGYQMMAVISRKALTAHNIKWDGTKQLSKPEQDRKAHTKAETKALEHVMESDPRKDGETMAKYLARCGDKVQEQLSKDNAEREAKMVDDLVKKIRTMAGGLLDDVVARILEGDTALILNEDAAQKAAPAATKH